MYLVPAGSGHRFGLPSSIPADEATGAGVAYVRLEGDPDPVRARAGWVTDFDIRALADRCIPDRVEWPEVAA